MRIAVVGGAGFVGRHLSLALLKRSHEVLVYDNLSARAGAGDQTWLEPSSSPTPMCSTGHGFGRNSCRFVLN